MMKLKVKEIGEGMHHSEVVACISTNAGDEGIVLDRRSLRAGYIAVGYPIRVEGDSYLVELPRETSSGSWRVWVNGSQLETVPEKEVA